MTWKLTCDHQGWPSQVLPDWNSGRSALDTIIRDLLEKGRSQEDDIDLKEAVEILRDAPADRPLDLHLQLDWMTGPVNWHLRQVQG